jgi:hypothetical protein
LFGQQFGYLWGLIKVTTDDEVQKPKYLSLGVGDDGVIINPVVLLKIFDWSIEDCGIGCIGVKLIWR